MTRRQPIRNARTLLQSWVLALFAAFMALSGCKIGADLSALPTYTEDFQRTYFEAQNHCLKGDLDLAYTGFLSCLELEPEETALRFDLAKIDLQRERFEAALVHLDAACSSDKENRWYREYRAKAALPLLLFESALEDLMFVQNQRPGDLEWTLEWSLILADEGAPQQALLLCDHYESLAPGDPDVLLQKLYFLELLEDYEEIYASLETAVLNHPDVPEFKMQWAQMLQATGQSEQAMQVLKTLANEDPTNGLVQLELAQLYTQFDDIEQAQNALRNAFASEEVYPEEKQEILVQYLQIIGLAEANPDIALDNEILSALKELIDIALRMHPDHAPILMVAADFEQSAGNEARAQKHLLKAVSANPGNRLAWSNLIALDANLGQIETMAEHAIDAMERFPLDVEFALMTGMAHLDLKDYNTSVDALERSLGLLVDDPALEARVAAMLGDALHALGQDDRAANAYEQSLDREPDNPMVLNNHAYYLALSGENLERALECSTRALELNPSSANLMDTHAWVLFKLERYPEAMDYITQALINAEKLGPAFLEHDGDIRSAMGDKEGAINSWKKALELGGDEESIVPKINGNR
jgi:tetratricopeptide (TPR) repeat protein